MTDLKELAQQGYTIDAEYLAGLGNDQAKQDYVDRLKRLAYQPGDQVRLRQNQILQWIEQFSAKPQMAEYVGVLKSLQNVGEKKLDIAQVHVDAVGDILYSFVGSDLKVEASFCTNPLPYIHEYGLLMLHDDRIWFVQIDDETSEAKRVFEITQEPGKAARHQMDIDSNDSLVRHLKKEECQAISGEFAVEDHGVETWGLLYTPWQSGALPNELDRATAAIREIVSNALSPN